MGGGQTGGVSTMEVIIGPDKTPFGGLVRTNPAWKDFQRTRGEEVMIWEKYSF